MVFLLGVQANQWRAVRNWRPVMPAMPRMPAELRAGPSLALLGACSGGMFGGSVQILYRRDAATTRRGAAYPRGYEGTAGHR